MVYRVILIGDPHFKISNTPETDLMVQRCVDVIAQERPDMIVVLGDVLDRFKNVHIDPMSRATKFFEELQPLTKRLVLIVGKAEMTCFCFLRISRVLNPKKQGNFSKYSK